MVIQSVINNLWKGAENYTHCATITSMPIGLRIHGEERTDSKTEQLADDVETGSLWSL